MQTHINGKDFFFATDSTSSTGSDVQVTARKVGESVTTALDFVANAFTYPFGMYEIMFRGVQVMIWQKAA